MKNITEEFDMSAISRYINIEEVRKNPFLAWDKKYLSSNRSMHLSDLSLDLPNSTGDWDFKDLHRYLPMEEIMEDTNYVWDRKELSYNSSMKLKFLDVRSPSLIGNWDMLLIHQHIDIQEVIDNPTYQWNRNNLSFNYGMTGFLKKYLYLPNSTARYINVPSCPELPEEIVDSLPNAIFAGEFTIYFASKRVSMELLRKYNLLPWDKQGLSLNNNITMDEVLHLDLPNSTGKWNFAALSGRMNMREIYKHLELPWSRLCMSENPQLTARDMKTLSPKVGMKNMYAFSDIDN